MTGMFFGTFFSLLIVMMVATFLFAYTWMRSHGSTYMGSSHLHLDSKAGDEGED
jgi:hypothetical protein